ncbi:hypothetical protein Lal_00046548 [Lupinus albus]|nr:hypothetical protein Lal_00046548 [Lupinus albus]
MVVTGDGELGFDSGEGSLRNGYHIKGRQQARKLPNPDTGEVVTINNNTGLMSLLDLGLGRFGPPLVCTGRLVPSAGGCAPGLNWPGRASGAVNFEEIRDSDPIVLAFGIGVMINRDSRGHSYFIVRGEILGFMKDEQLRKHLPRNNESWARRRSDTVLGLNHNDADQGSADVAFRTPLAPYEKSKSLGSGEYGRKAGNLKGIDGRAPPGGGACGLI